MIDRDKISRVLRKRFPEASPQQVAWTVTAIVGLGDEWEEVECEDTEVACLGPSATGGRCYLADGLCQGTEFRLFRKRWPDVRQ